MAEIKISELSSILSDSIIDDDLMVIVHAGTTYKISIQNIKKAVAISDYIHISSSQTIDNDIYRDILVTTGTGSLILSLSGNEDKKITNITKIDSGSGYVLLSSSYAGNTILNSSQFGLYYQQECVNLRFNSSSLNYDLI